MDDVHDTVGSWTTLSDPAVAEMAAGAGFDYLISGADLTHLVEGQRRALEAAEEILYRGPGGTTDDRDAQRPVCQNSVSTVPSASR